jgi:peptide/nickel transport system ATP-binding protein
VEEQPVKQLFQHPQHAYTKALLACRPANHPRGERLPVVSDFLDSGELNKHTIPTSFTPHLKEKTSEQLIEVRNLSVWFPAKKTFFGKPLQFIHAVDDVSFEVYNGETLGLVGESGCGKTTLGRTLLRLIEPTSGHIIYKGKDLAAMRSSELRMLRKNIQIVFQDPYSSLNPRITIGSAIAEPLKVHGLVVGERKRKDQVVELLEKVNLPADHYNRYPHEFSGGQRQRIVIARALALNPSFIVCDESVSALDVSVQAQVLNLLNDLKKEYGFTVIFISHDLAVVRYISDRIMVMNRGRIVETGDADSIYTSPKSDYTKKLIAAIPQIF